MNLKMALLLGCLLGWLAYGCGEKEMPPIDMPDPTDTIPMDTIPLDTMPFVDTTWKVLVNEMEGNYLGTCYIQRMPSMDPFDTVYNVTITLDSIERVKIHGRYEYFMKYENGFYTFRFPEAEFIQDTVDASSLGGSQVYSKTLQLIRSQRFLYMKSGVYPGPSFMISECYCNKQ
jgi:hypothetical protein